MTLDEFIAEKSADGWQVTLRTNDGIQLQKQKRWNQIGLLVGFVGLFFGGIGVIFLALTVLDYLFQSEKLVYVKAADIAEGRVPLALDKQNSTAKLAFWAVLGVVLFGLILWAALAFIPAMF